MVNQEQQQVIDEEMMKREQEKEIEIGKSFPYLPDANYPSDHMALVADLEFMPTMEETSNTLATLKLKRVSK